MLPDLASGLSGTDSSVQATADRLLLFVDCFIRSRDLACTTADTSLQAVPIQQRLTVSVRAVLMPTPAVLRTTVSTMFQTVCLVDDLRSGQSKMFNIHGQMIGVFNVDGEFLAVSNECPHAGASLAHGSFDGDVVSCRIHHWRFCLRSGRYLDQDKPEFNARTFSTRVVDGEVQVSLDAGDE